MHVHRLPIAAVSIQDRCHNDELVLCNKVPDAALMLGRFVAVYGVEVEFEGGGEGRKEQQSLQKAE